jgi:hypothetical protein
VVDERITALEQAVPVSGLLGYLNFSDGRPDPRWQRQLDDAFVFLTERGEAAPWQVVLDCLPVLLKRLQDSGASAFRDAHQAEAALTLAARVLPDYRHHHADLLAHLTDAELFNSFFLARVFEAILRQGTADSGDGAATAIVARLNDFVGHRPVALLETRPRGEPYDHERTRPIPLWIQGAGSACGRYRALVERTIELLEATDPDILTEAQFEPKLVDELAVDARPYDHGHPVNRRPNYVFGEWDPHHLDGQGRYRRYVVRKVTLDALLDRVEQGGSLDRSELLEEAAAVLAGTVLMACGTSGASPTAHDSATTLAALLPRIARYRDAFYEHLLKRMNGAHAVRLRQEREATRQPFGAARQHLNAYLARDRATQMQQRYLALLFAEMGYPEASREEAERIAVVSVRLASAALGGLTAGRVEADAGELRQAAARLPETEDILDRGIACGAFADPWNALGFQGLFPLSPAREDSVRDARLDELVGLIEQLFNLYARLISEAAAAGDDELVRTLTVGLEKRAAWWDRFATHEVSDVRRVHGGEAATSAAHVAKALARWHARGEAPADLAFWRGLLEGFQSPKSFALVVDTLLHKEDYRAALALLTAWLGRAEQVPLEDGVWSFPTLALRWMLALTRGERGAERGTRISEESGVFAIPNPRSTLPYRERQALVVKFFDFLEANAEEFWQVPALELNGDNAASAEEEDTEGLYSAAYDDVTYRDSTDDSEGAVSDGGPTDEFDLDRESVRLEKRLRFLSTVARLWQVAARFLAAPAADRSGAAEARTALTTWLATARFNRHKLLALLDTVHARPLPDPGGAYDALVEFDRRRVLKEQLLYAAIGTCLDTSLAAGALHGALDAVAARSRSAAGAGGEDEAAGASAPAPAADDDGPPWEAAAIRLEQALFRGDAAGAREALGPFLEAFQREPLLVTPLTEGGQPRQVLRVRIAQTVLRALLSNLPRLGLLRETFDLLKAARTMEQTQPPRGRGVTEFNHFFQASYQAVLESAIESAATWDAAKAGDAELVEILERLTAPFLALWVEHSRSLQLSVLETVAADSDWIALQNFVQHYGGDLFHARFLTLGNLRGVLHRGVGPYVDYLRENPDPLRPVKLIEDLGRTVRREDAVRRLEVVLQAVVESYEEYKDYNTTTTQSDYGENLHVLLDFLRLKAGYERHAWQFRPLVLAHEVLARRGRNAAAVLWERQLTQFTRDLARKHLDQLAALEKSRGIRLGTVSDRLGERFVKPLALDRLAALIEPAMNEARREGPRPTIARLLSELPAYTATPSGVGLDVPYWLRRLEMEVRRVQATQTTIAVLAESFFRVPRQPLPYEELQRQLREWGRPALPE